MEDILSKLVMPGHPNLLVGLDRRDDAAIYKIRDDLALIQTLDFFTPMIDDPYTFGQIAAANALNDVYAMGGTPFLALNIVCYPECENLEVLGRILAGGLSKVQEAGAVLAGGHTVDDNEPKYGLSVCGMVHPDRVVDNAGACTGDVLFLTKPLGNGVVATSIKAQMVSDEAYQEAVKWMAMLNKDASQVMQEVGVHAATDITGFGLIGHLYEMAAASNKEVELYAGGLEFMTGAMEYANLGLIPGGAYTNREYLAGKVEYKDEIKGVLRELLFSPETSGGLLIAVDEQKAEQLQTGLRRKGCRCFQVGRVTGDEFRPIRIRR